MERKEFEDEEGEITMNIWKIASRWSNTGTVESSIIDIFRKYKVVFAGKKQEEIKRKVKINDLVAISDGLTIVAIGKVLDNPKKLTEFKMEESDINSGRFGYEDSVIGVKVSLYNLETADQFKYIQGTFHGVNEHSDKIKKLFDKYTKDYLIDRKFSIDAKTCTLRSENGILEKGIKYIIPVYQRPYSWEEVQVKKLISDIFKSFYGYDKQSSPEPMFIGTLQLTGKEYVSENSFEQEIVDGQQRMTTLLLMVKVLKCQFPENQELKNMGLDWLQTRVNNGEQQKYLKDL